MKRQSWILVGGDTLLGREIRDLVDEKKLPVNVRLCGGNTGERVIMRADDEELAVMEPLDADILEDAAVILLAGSAETSREALALVRSSGSAAAVVDVTGDLEDLPESRLRAPALEKEGLRFDRTTVHSVVHPAAAALARMMTALHARHAIRRAVVNLFEPASARGKQAVDELHKQTVSLFGFQQMPKEIFDTQVSFNLLPRYGDEAKSTLRSGELRLERHVATLLGAAGVALPSVRLIHAPVFHGYCQSLWVEFESRPVVAEIEKLLAGEGMDVRSADVEPASNMGVAGQSGIIVSDIAEDHSSASALWIWFASDNMRSMAENAVLTAATAARQSQAGGA